jgi:hypothetical protein
MTARTRTRGLVRLARRAWVGARAGATMLRDGLGVAGWGGVIALALGIGASIAASQVEREATRLDAEAAQARDDARLAAIERARTPAGRPAPVLAPADRLALPADRPAQSVLPASFFARAERRGVRVGPVEYRSVKHSASVRRVDVALTVSGRYLATRQWLAESLVALPHAQLLELTMQRSDPAEADLEVRVVLAVHFGERT